MRPDNSLVIQVGELETLLNVGAKMLQDKMSSQFVTVLTGDERLQSPPDRPSSSYTGDTCQYEINGAQKSLYTKR